MRRSLLLSALLLALPVLAHAQDGQRPEVTAAAQRLQAKVVEWRRDFHQHPELSNREVRTSAEVAKRLNSINGLPDVRAERIARIREEFRAGTFETPEKLREAIRNFLEDSI